MCLTKVKEKFLWVVRKLFTLLGFFSILGGRIFDFLESKNIFNPCLYIEFNTQNPNPIFKITIPFTKTPKKPKHFRKRLTFFEIFLKISKIQNFQKPKKLFCILYTFHNSYFLLFFRLITVFEKKNGNFQKSNFLFCIMYTFHNSYFYIFCIFYNILYFIYLYI